MSEFVFPAVTVGWLADFFDRDERTMQLWFADCRINDEFGKYDVLKCMKRRLDKLADDLLVAEKGDAQKYKLEVEQLKLKNVRAQMLIDKDAKRLVETDLVRERWTGEVIMINGALNNLEIQDEQIDLIEDVTERRKARKKIYEDMRNGLNSNLDLAEETDESDDEPVQDETEIEEPINN